MCGKPHHGSSKPDSHSPRRNEGPPDIRITELLDAVPGLTMLVSSSHRILDANEALLNRFGIERHKARGRICSDLIFGRHGRCRGCPVRGAMEGHATEMEYFDETVERWFCVSAVPLRTKTLDGQRIFLHIATDITARKESENELKTNFRIQSVVAELLQAPLSHHSLEDQLLSILDHLLSVPWLSLKSMGAIFLLSDETGELELAVERNFSVAHKRCCTSVRIGECVCGLAQKSQKIEFVSAVDERHTKVPPDVTPHGHYCVPIKNGQPQGVLCVYVPEGHQRDKTEQRLLELASDVIAGVLMRHATNFSAELFRLAMEKVNDGIFILDPKEGRIIGHNEVACRRLGYRSEELKRLEMKDIETEVSGPATWKKLNDENEESHIVLKGCHKTAQGKRIPVEVSISKVAVMQRPLVVAVARDISDRLNSEKRLERSLARLEKTLLGTIEAMTHVVETRDPYTAGHQKRVSRLSEVIAREMGLPERRVEGMRIAGLVHDLGKIAIPSEILSKPSRLSPIEFEFIRIHSQVGFNILNNIEFPWPIAEIVLQHHERMDGRGYPRGLRGEELNLEARILGVADTVEAIASHRPYRPALGLDRALDQIVNDRGTLFDPDVVDICLKAFGENGFSWDAPALGHPTK